MQFSRDKNCKNQELAKVPGDLDAYEEHGHDVGDEDEGGGGTDESHSDRSVAVLVHTKVEEYESEASEEEHEAGGEALDDVLTIDTSRQEDDRPHCTSMGVLAATDSRWLHDHVVDDARHHHEVSDEDEREHRHGGG